MISDPMLFFIVSGIGFVGGVFLAARQAKESAHFGENSRRRMRVRPSVETIAASNEYSGQAPAA